MGILGRYMSEGKELGGHLAELYRAGDGHLGDAVAIYDTVLGINKSGSDGSFEFWQTATESVNTLMTQARDNVQHGADVLIAMAISFASVDEAAADEFKRLADLDELPEYTDGEWK